MSRLVSSGATPTHPAPLEFEAHISQHSAEQDPLPLPSSSSGSESEVNVDPLSTARPTSRKSRMDRPRMAERQRSSSIIIPKGGDTFQQERPDYGPDDARAMSPRRTSEDLERLELGVRKSLQDQAHVLQSSLQALANRIDEVRQDHDRLENENRLLQEYIGGLTRSMSKDNIARSSSVRKGKR